MELTLADPEKRGPMVVDKLAEIETEFLAELEKISEEHVLQIQFDKEKNYLGKP